MKDWLRNEWVWQDGAWVQDMTQHCLVNCTLSWNQIEFVIRNWDDHQWIYTDDVIIGIPSRVNETYLVVFSKV